MTVFDGLRGFAERFSDALALLVIFGLVGFIAAGWGGLLAGLVVFLVGAVLGAFAEEFGAELWRRAAGLVEGARQRVRKWWLLRRS
jgi:hypothetical protein